MKWTENIRYVGFTKMFNYTTDKYNYNICNEVFNKPNESYMRNLMIAAPKTLSIIYEGIIRPSKA